MQDDRDSRTGGEVVPFRPRSGNEAWVTKDQLARHLQVSEKTVERWVAEGMPRLRKVRTLRFRISRCEASAGGDVLRMQKRGARYKVEVYDSSRQSKKRYVGTFATEREAKDAGLRAELEVSARRGRRGDDTVRSWSERWLVLRPRRKESTNAGYSEQVKPFVRDHGELKLRDVGVELALEWTRAHQWTHGGLQAMFSDARRSGLVEQNPFTELRLKRSNGRKDLDVLPRGEIERLADCAQEVWEVEAALTVRTLILCAAFLGMRPAELYGLHWSDLDLRQDEVRVERQYSAKSRTSSFRRTG